MLPFVIKIFVLSIFEWPFYTGFTVLTFADFCLIFILSYLFFFIKEKKQKQLAESVHLATLQLLEQKMAPKPPSPEPVYQQKIGEYGGCSKI